MMFGLVIICIINIALAAISIGCIPAIRAVERRIQAHARRAEAARDEIKRLRGIVP